MNYERSEPAGLRVLRRRVTGAKERPLELRKEREGTWGREKGNKVGRERREKEREHSSRCALEKEKYRERKAWECPGERRNLASQHQF